MDRVIFVEVLDRRGRVTHRVRLDDLPATVGRGYGNAVILDDRYVSPEHARIAVGPDGSLVVEDLASTNGLFAAGDAERVAQVALSPGAQFRVGQTWLRVATSDQAVAPAARDPAIADTPPPLVGPRLAPALVVALGLSMVTSYLGSYGETSIAGLIADALSLGTALTAWAGGWALITRITSHRFAFVRHLAVATSVLLVVEGLYLIARVGDVVESGTTFYELAQTVTFMLALAALLHGHLGVAVPLGRRRRAAWALGVAGALVGLDRFTDFAAGPRFEALPSFVGAVRPLARAGGASLDAFVASVAELQGGVDKQAEAAKR